VHPDAVVLLPPSRLWSAWTLDPGVLGGIGAAALLYQRGWSTLRRQHPARPVVRVRQAAAFFAGLGLLGVALVSPLDALDGTLLSAHMAQHLLLLTVAPPLLVYGRPGLVGRVGLPSSLRPGLRDLERTGGWRWCVGLTRKPWAVLGAVTAALWLWHLPVAYDAAAIHPPLHLAEHACFLGTALAFWRLIIDGNPRRRLAYAPGMVLTFVVMLQTAALGAVIALSPQLLYPAYRVGPSLWGMTPLGDQQLAGALMWIPMGGLYLVTIVALAARWFAAQERRTPQHAATQHAAPQHAAPLLAAPLLAASRLPAEPATPEAAP